MTMARPYKTACVTGASRGLGLAVAEELHKNGWHIALVARNSEKLETEVSRLQSLPGGGAVLALALNLEQQTAPELLFQFLRDHWDGLGALINNAGAQGPIGPLWECPQEEWERLFRLLLFAPAALCRLAIPWMCATGGGKIINISGGGATGPRPNFTAYAAAKAGLVRLTETLAAECTPFGITVNAVAPGAMPTELLRDVLTAGAERSGKKEYATAAHLLSAQDSSVIQKAARCVTALAESESVTGKLISAVWDPWEHLAEHTEDLASDIYTLRRITPKDRGKTWGNDL